MITFVPAALVTQAAEIHVFVGECVGFHSFGVSDSIPLVSDFVDLVFSLIYNAIKAADTISSNRNTIKKAKRTLEGFRVSGSCNNVNGMLIFPTHLKIENTATRLAFVVKER